MKNLKRLLKKLGELDLPKKEMCIFGSAPLAIRGVRDVNDLDVVVSKKLFFDLEKKYSSFIKKNKYGEYIDLEEIKIYYTWPYVHTKELLENCEIINNFPFAKIEHVIKYKKKLLRHKDIEDLFLLEKYFKNNK